MSPVPTVPPSALPARFWGPSFALVLSERGQVLTMTLTLAHCPAWLAWPMLNRIYNAVPGTSRIYLDNANRRQLSRGLPSPLRDQPALGETWSATGSDLEVPGSLPEAEGHCWECSHSADTIHTQMAGSHGEGWGPAQASQPLPQWSSKSKAVPIRSGE